MNSIELLDIISSSENSKVQFKQKIIPDDLAIEMVAFANSLGGMIILGVHDKTHEIVGLDASELEKYNKMAANVANDVVKPMIFVKTEVVPIDTGREGVKKVLIIYVDEGNDKPYKDKNSAIWLKQGPDKRRVFDNSEILRLIQKGGHFSVDEMVIQNTSIDDINKSLFEQFFMKSFEQAFENSGMDYNQTLRNLNIIRGDSLTLGGLLFFGKEPQRFKPAFNIKAVSFFGNEISGSDYRDSKDLNGTIPEIFNKGISFFTSNLKQVQQGQNFNSLGILEISKIALEELLQNALIHRDYSKNAPIRLLIFDNRIELISPGCLPNSLTIENIKFGNTVLRNNLLATFCSKTMLYRGLGSGVQRALKEQPDIEFINDSSGEQFIVKIPRPN